MVQSASYTRSRSDGRSGRHLQLYRPIDAGTARVIPLRVGAVSSAAVSPAPRPGRSARSVAASPRTAVAPARRPPARPDPSVYRRRRLLAAGLFLVAIAAAALLAQLIQAGIGGGPLAATGAAAGSTSMIPAGTREYVVQPGDTLWSIADRVDPNGDERPLVDVLARETSSRVLYPGERIAIPAHW